MQYQSTLKLIPWQSLFFLFVYNPQGLLPSQVGILGQPECSKQGFVSVILRLVEHTGTIRIDGMDVSEIGLRDLREKISVVPQVGNPLLITRLSFVLYELHTNIIDR